MKQTSLMPTFVEFIPEKLSDGILYISERYRTASHKCCCGCGQEVVTPLTPVDWLLALLPALSTLITGLSVPDRIPQVEVAVGDKKKEEGLVTLHPSIGNWSFACRSHYWIRRNRIIWDGTISQRQVDRVRARDQADKETYIAFVNKNKRRPKDKVLVRPVRADTSSTRTLHQLWNAFCRWLNH